MKSIYLFSSCEHSLLNRGDLAMLLGLIGWIKESLPGLRIVVYTSDPKSFAEIPELDNIDFSSTPEIYFIPSKLSHSALGRRILRYRWGALLKGVWFNISYLLYRIFGSGMIGNPVLLKYFEEISSAAGLIFVGGGYLNSLWWLDGLYGKTFAAIAARKAGVPIILSGLGIGPLTHPLDQWVTKQLLNCVRKIGVRDLNQSEQTIRSLSQNLASKVVQAWDDALLLDETELPNSIGAVLERQIADLRPALLIGVNLRDSSSYYSKNHAIHRFRDFAQTLDSIVAKGNRQLIFIPISYNKGDDDRESAKAVASMMRHPERVLMINEQLHPKEIKRLIREMDVTIGISYHFNLFALSQNVPAIGLYENEYYHRKITGLFSIYSLELHCFDLSSNHQTMIDELTENVISNRKSIARSLAHRNESLKSEATEARRNLFEELAYVTSTQNRL